MNVDKISKEQAFEAGSELWIVPDQQNEIWQDLDYRSGFLLSTCKAHQKAKVPFKIDEIVQETLMDKKDFSTSAKSLLIGTADHFFNKWILIVPENTSDALTEIADTCATLKVSSVRFFSTSEVAVKSVATRLSASLSRISFVE